MACAVNLSSTDKDFVEKFNALLSMKREQSVDVNQQVAVLIDDVRARGDQALIDLTARFDALTLNINQLRIGQDEIERATADCAPDILAALDMAAIRIRDFHERQKPEDQIGRAHV